jgi:hypothetical protein
MKFSRFCALFKRARDVHCREHLVYYHRIRHLSTRFFNFFLFFFSAFYKPEIVEKPQPSDAMYFPFNCLKMTASWRRRSPLPIKAYVAPSSPERASGSPYPMIFESCTCLARTYAAPSPGYSVNCICLARTYAAPYSTTS